MFHERRSHSALPFYFIYHFLSYAVFTQYPVYKTFTGKIHSRNLGVSLFITPKY